MTSWTLSSQRRGNYPHQLKLTITEPVDATLNQANLTMAGREYRRKTNPPGSNEALEELTGREGRAIEFIASPSSRTLFLMNLLSINPF
jgi:hypothetical protein